MCFRKRKNHISWSVHIKNENESSRRERADGRNQKGQFHRKAGNVVVTGRSGSERGQRLSFVRSFSLLTLRLEST